MMMRKIFFKRFKLEKDRSQDAVETGSNILICSKLASQNPLRPYLLSLAVKGLGRKKLKTLT